MTSPVGLHVVDNQNGSMSLYWPPFTGISPASYNVYLNRVLNQNVAVRTAVVTGLQQASYNGTTITAPGTYDFKVIAVVGGIEVAQSTDRIVTVSPTTIMLTTPMRRPFPFPATGMDTAGYGG